MPDENKVYAHRGEEFHATVKAKTFWLELGDLRRLVAAAEGLPDEAGVLVDGIKPSLRKDEYHVMVAHVRHTDWERGK